MITVGLTGGIASGKSLVAEYFRTLGVPVIDTDEIARQVVAPGHPAWHRLRETFGSSYFLPDGTLDRAALACRVFTDPASRHTLEAITHPAIFAEVDRQLRALAQQAEPPTLVVVAVPLLYEVAAEDRFDKVVVVYAHPDQQRARMSATRGYSPEDIEGRLAAQMPPEEKARRADAVIDNTGTPEETFEQVHSLLRQLRSHSK